MLPTIPRPESTPHLTIGASVRTWAPPHLLRPAGPWRPNTRKVSRWPIRVPTSQEQLMAASGRNKSTRGPLIVSITHAATVTCLKRRPSGDLSPLAPELCTDLWPSPEPPIHHPARHVSRVLNGVGSAGAICLGDTSRRGGWRAVNLFLRGLRRGRVMTRVTVSPSGPPGTRATLWNR